MTFGISFLAWLVYVPFIYYLRITEGWRPKLCIILALLAGWSLAVLKIVSPPIPVIMSLLYALPIALFHGTGFIIWSFMKNKKFDHLAFPAIMVISEWALQTFTPFATWGAVSYTQINNLPILQITSLFGIAGLGFIIYLVNILLEKLFLSKSVSKRTVLIAGATISILLSYGYLRLTILEHQPKSTVLVAAVGTNNDVSGLPIPEKNKLNENIEKLLARTSKAVENGAKLIVWNEAAAVIYPEDEDKWNTIFCEFAAEKNVTLIASYIVPVSETPLKYENKYLYIQNNGSIALNYLKHEPVPGEPAVKGKSDFQAVEESFAKVSGAICYDYDFSKIGREHGKIEC